MGLFSGFRRGGDKKKASITLKAPSKKLSKPAPPAVQAQKRSVDAILFGDDPYLRDKEARIQDRNEPVAERDFAPRLTGAGIASARSSLELLPRPWTAGNEASIPRSASVGSAVHAVLDDALDSHDARPRTSHGSASKPWVNRRSLSGSRFRPIHSQSQSLPRMSLSRDGTQSREIESDNGASVTSSAQRSSSFDDQASRQPLSPRSPPSSVSGRSPTPQQSKELSITKPPSPRIASPPFQDTPLNDKISLPTAMPETAKRMAPHDEAPRRRDAARPSRAPVVASASIAVNPKFIKNVQVPHNGSKTKARDAAKKKDLAISIPRRQNWSRKIEELERSWLEEQLSLGGHDAEDQNFNEVRQQIQQNHQTQHRPTPSPHQNHPPRQSSQQSPALQQQHHHQQQKQQYKYHQHQQYQHQQHQHQQHHQHHHQQFPSQHRLNWQQPIPKHKPQVAAWDDQMLSSSSWQYPTRAPMERHHPSAHSHRPGMRTDELSPEALAMGNQWPDRGAGGRLHHGRQAPMLRVSQSMHNLSGSSRKPLVSPDPRDPRAWREHPLPRGSNSQYHRGGTAAPEEYRNAAQRTNGHSAYRLADVRYPARGHGPFPKSPYPFSPTSPEKTPATRSENLDSSRMGSFDYSLSGYSGYSGSAASSPMDSPCGDAPMNPPSHRPIASLQLHSTGYRSVSTPLERLPASAMNVRSSNAPPQTTEALLGVPAATANTSGVTTKPKIASVLSSVHSAPSAPSTPLALLTKPSPDSLAEERLNRLTIDSFPLPSPTRHRPSTRQSPMTDRLPLSSPVVSVEEMDGAGFDNQSQSEEIPMEPTADGLERTESNLAKGKTIIEPAEDDGCSVVRASLDYFEATGISNENDSVEDNLVEDNPVEENSVKQNSVEQNSVEEILAKEDPTEEGPVEEKSAEENFFDVEENSFAEIYVTGSPTEEDSTDGSSDNLATRWETPTKDSQDDDKNEEVSFSELMSLSPLSQPAGDAVPSAKANWPLIPSVLVPVAAHPARPVSEELFASPSLVPGLAVSTPEEEVVAPTEAKDEDSEEDEDWGTEEALPPTLDSPFKAKSAFTASVYREEIGSGPYAPSALPDELQAWQGEPVSAFDVSPISTTSSKSSTPSESLEKSAPWVVYARRQDSLNHLSGVKRATAATAATAAAVAAYSADDSTTTVVVTADGMGSLASPCLPSTPAKGASRCTSPESYYGWSPNGVRSMPISPESIGLARGESIYESFGLPVGVAIGGTAADAGSEVADEMANNAVKKWRRMAGFHHYMYSDNGEGLWNGGVADEAHGVDSVNGADKATGLAQHTAMGRNDGIIAGFV